MPPETTAAVWPTVDDIRRYERLLTGLPTSATIQGLLQVLRDEGHLNGGYRIREEWALLHRDGLVYREISQRSFSTQRAEAELSLYLMRIGNDVHQPEPDWWLVRRLVLAFPPDSPLPTERTPWRVVPTPQDPPGPPPHITVVDRVDSGEAIDLNPTDRSTDVPG